MLSKTNLKKIITICESLAAMRSIFLYVRRAQQFYIPFLQTFGYEEIKRNNRWWQHNWQLSNNLKVIKAPISSTDKLAVFDRKIEKSDVKMMPLQAFVEILGHKKSTISFLNSNQYENVWNLLRHVIVNHATIDVEQVIATCYTVFIFI